MNMHVWLPFLIGTILICGSPGPNMLQVMTSSARNGFKYAFFAMAGCFIPVFGFICLSLAGVGTLLETFPAIFDALRYAGAAYLIYLGIMAWTVPIATETGLDAAVLNARTPKTIFKHSFLVGISNPKALLFATAYFPQFLDPHAPQAIQFVILLATFSVVEITWYILYALGGSTIAVRLKKPSIRQWFDRFTGTLFIGFGVSLIAKGR